MVIIIIIGMVIIGMMMVIIDDKNKLFEWYDGYKKRKAKKELTPIAWNPSRWWGWCMSEEEKKETEKLWA